MTSLTKPRLVYFSSRGLAEQIRIILAESGTEYDDVGFGQTVNGKQPDMFLELKAKDVLLFDQVPLWEEPNGIRVVQSSAIVRHLARANGLYGKNEKEMAICDALHEYLVDARNTASAYQRATDATKKEEIKNNLLQVEFPKILARLEKILRENGTGHLVGSSLTFADLIWWYYLENLSDQGIVDVSKYENLHKFKTAIEARPSIAAYRGNPKRYPIQWFFGRYVMYSYPNNPNAFKSLIAAEYAGIKVEVPPFQMGVENKTPEFLAKNPNGQVPTMDTPDGPLYESNAIAKYVARKGTDKGLYGANEYESSQIDQWVEFYRSKLEDEVSGWIRPIMLAQYDKEKYEASKVNVTTQFKILNNHLDGREWIVGKRVTLADIIIFCSLSRGFQHAFDPEYLKAFPNISAWAHRCIEQAQFKAVFTQFEFSTKEKQPGELVKK